MRKIWIFVLAFSLLFAMTACKKDSKNKETPAKENTESSKKQEFNAPASVKDFISEDAVVVIPEKDAAEIIPDVKIPEKAERGNQIGDICVSGKLRIIDAQGDTNILIDPSVTGRPTIITFWGTWCAPSIEDLKVLDEIARGMGDAAAVIAVHSAVGSDTAVDFIKENYPDSPIIFTLDEEIDGTGYYYNALGGADIYPFTVVLNPKGEIMEIINTPVTTDQLRQLMEEADIQ